MKLDALKKIIRTEVKSAIREELQDILKEAVEIASRPASTQHTKPVRPRGVEEDLQTFVEQRKNPINKKPGNVMSEMLEETRGGMSKQDFVQMMGGPPQKIGDIMNSDQDDDDSEPLPNIPGLGKAKAIYEAAQKKSKR